MQTVVMRDLSGNVRREYIFLYPEDDCGPLCHINCVRYRTSRPIYMHALMECLENDVRDWTKHGYTFTCYIEERSDVQ
jgi:hypothetical protein